MERDQCTTIQNRRNSSNKETVSVEGIDRTADKEPVQTLMDIFSGMEGAEVRRRHGGKLYFRMYMTQAMSESGIESLELSVRAYNCLKRAGYSTIGQLAEAIAAGTNISRLRSCGAKTSEEIMVKLFLYQYEMLKPEKREAYLRETIRLNYERKTQSAAS